MRDAQLVDTLSEMNVSQLIATQHLYGRLNLPANFREDWTKQCQHACEILEDEGRGLKAKRLARLLKEITHSLATVENNAQPTYYQYTDAHLLDWFLDPGLSTLSSLRSRIILGLHYILKDLLNFEASTLGGVNKTHSLHVVPQRLYERIDSIRNVFPSIEELAARSDADCRWDYDLQHYRSLAGYVNEPTGLSALVHFSCFPLTQFHDEVVFIRVLHGSELCFFGIRLCLIAAIEAIKSEKPAVAERELERGDGFARILHLFLKVLRTMPPAHFADFRDYTGKASALQSKAYHELDIYMRGVNIEKRHHFDGVDYLKPLVRYADKRFISLKDALRRVMELPEWQGVVAMARNLDRNLLSWRGLHVGFAKGYIPRGAQGTGGTSGALYLEQHLNDGIFKGTEMDWALVERIFASDPDVIDELHRINTRATISSGDRL